MRQDEGMTVREILELPNNRQVYGQFVVRECELRGSEGRYFLRLLLGDKTGSIPAYVWNLRRKPAQPESRRRGRTARRAGRISVQAENRRAVGRHSPRRQAPA